MGKKISMKSMLNDKYDNFVPTSKMMELDFMDTGMPTINYLISGRPFTGGLPLSGKITTLYGVEAAGKTTLTGHIMKRALDKEIDVVFFDTESSVTNRRLAQFGIDPEDEHFMLFMPDTMENVFDMIDTIYDFRMSKGLQDEPCIIVWDSVAGTATQEMVERKADQKEIGSEAKVLARGLKRVRPKLRKMNAGFVLINQARANQDMYGDLFKMLVVMHFII